MVLQQFSSVLPLTNDRGMVLVITLLLLSLLSAFLLVQISAHQLNFTITTNFEKRLQAWQKAQVVLSVHITKITPRGTIKGLSQRVITSEATGDYRGAKVHIWRQYLINSMGHLTCIGAGGNF